MLLSLLSKFVATLLTLSLLSVTTALVLNQTVLNSKYVEHQLKTTDSYTRLSGAINKQIIEKSSDADPAVAAKLEAILTPQVLETKINSALDQIHAYYRGNGPAPVIDLTDLAAQAQAAGVPIPADSDINKPIALGTGDNQTYKISKDSGRADTATRIACVVLAAVLALLCWKRGKWTPLAHVAIAVGVLLGLLALLLSAVSGMLADHARIAVGANPFEVIGRDLGSVILKDLAKQFGIIAAAVGVGGIAARILIARLGTAAPAPTSAPIPARPPARTRAKASPKIVN